MSKLVTVSGSVQVFCGHGVHKRQVTDLVADLRRERVWLCPCCQNLYPTQAEEPGPCPACSDHTMGA